MERLRSISLFLCEILKHWLIWIPIIGFYSGWLAKFGVNLEMNLIVGLIFILVGGFIAAAVAFHECRMKIAKKEGCFDISIYSCDCIPISKLLLPFNVWILKVRLINLFLDRPLTATSVWMEVYAKNKLIKRIKPLVKRRCDKLREKINIPLKLFNYKPHFEKGGDEINNFVFLSYLKVKNRREYDLKLVVEDSRGGTSERYADRK